MDWRLDNIEIRSYPELLKYVSEEDIYLRYFGEFQLNKKYLCPFKHEKTPSFEFKYINNRIKWVRYGMYGDRSYGALDFVMFLKNLTFLQALQVIFNDLYINNTTTNDFILKKETFTLTSSLKYDFNLLDYEMNYWKQYHFTKEDLKYWKVYSCTEYWINGIKWHTSTIEDPMFVYLHSEDSWTIYRPLAKDKENKFRKYNITKHLMGYDKLPEIGEILFITSSYKDVITLYKLGYNAVAPHSERNILDKSLVLELKSRFKYIYVAYDNDDTGVNASKGFTELYDLRYWNIPKDCDGNKDPSDYSKCNGLDKLDNNIKAKFKRDEI